jgi:drug/metabolite transporter (DMT)-like permease
MTAPRPSRIKIVLAFAAVYVLWGSTYLGIRLAIETLPPFLMAGTRFMLAGAIIFTWAVLKGERSIPPLHMWRRALAIGGLLLLGGNGGVTWAEKYVPTGLAALLVSTEPLWVVVLNWALSRRRPNWKVLLGVLIGLAGVAMLVGDGLKSNGHSMWNLIGGGVVLVGSFSWAAGSVYSNRRPLPVPTLMAAGGFAQKVTQPAKQATA